MWERTQHLLSRMKHWKSFRNFKNKTPSAKLLSLFERLLSLSAFVYATGSPSCRVMHCNCRGALIEATSPAYWKACGTWRRCFSSRRIVDEASLKTWKIPTVHLHTPLNVSPWLWLWQRVIFSRGKSNARGRIARKTERAYIAQRNRNVVNLMIVFEGDPSGDNGRRQILSRAKPCR